MIQLTIDIIILGLAVIFEGIALKNLRKRVENLEWQMRAAARLISEETKRKTAHTEAFKNLTDPDKIQEEMERGADILEARQANRLTMPRENAGPPARVFRPRLVGKRASFWNPPRS